MKQQHFNSLHSADSFDSFAHERPQGPFVALLERAQSLAPLSDPGQHDFGGRTIPTKKYGDVSVQRMYGYASLQLESSFDFVSGEFGGELKRYKVELEPKELRIFKVGQPYVLIEVSPSVNLNFEKLITDLELSCTQQQKIVRKGFLDLLQVPGLTIAQRVAWGLSNATARIGQAHKLLKYQEDLGPLDQNVDDAMDILQRVVRDLRAMKSHISKVLPREFSDEDFETSVIELHGTSVDLSLESSQRTRQSIDMAFRRIAKAKKIIEDRKAATAHHRREPIAA